MNLESELVKPTITPRFALSCTRDLMQGLAKLAEDHDLHIQVGCFQFLRNLLFPALF